MSLPSTAQLWSALDATWPAARYLSQAPWTLRAGADGGKRVSAATADGPVTANDLASAEAGMQGLGQAPLFMIRQEDTALDDLLARRGYAVLDPVILYASPIRMLAEEPRLTRATPSWPPLAVQLEIWRAGGIGPARYAVMERVKGAKTSLLGREGDSPAGVAFIALDRDIAMLHALEVLPELRRSGLGRDLVKAAAFWAAKQGAKTFALAVTEANVAANALYHQMGLTKAACYHYRQAPGAGH